MILITLICFLFVVIADVAVFSGSQAPVNLEVTNLKLSQSIETYVECIL